MAYCGTGLYVSLPTHDVVYLSSQVPVLEVGPVPIWLVATLLERKHAVQATNVELLVDVVVSIHDIFLFCLFNPSIHSYFIVIHHSNGLVLICTLEGRSLLDSWVKLLLNLRSMLL